MEPKRLQRIINILKNASSKFNRRLEFFGKNSGIHGLKKIFDENTYLVSRLFWIVIVLISSGCLYILVVPVVDLNDQVNFTPDTRYLHWVTTFPAVTVCETYNGRLAQRKFLSLYPDLMEPMSLNLRKYMTEILYGRGTCGKPVCLPCGAEVPCDVNWREIMKKIHKSCTEMIADCSFNGQEFPCCKKFLHVDSEYGPCFAFNTLQNKDSSEPLYIVNRTTGPGILKFRVLFDAQISVHSPEELATNVLDYKLKFDLKTQRHNRIHYLFSMVEMENDPVLLASDINVRGCRNLDEVPEETMHNYPVYSYGACRLAEDTEHLFKHCGCVHPVRHSSYKHLYCNYTGINCLILSQVQAQILSIEKHEQSDGCLPSCVESELSTIHISRQWVLEDETEGTLVTIQMASLPNLRYIRNLIRTDLDAVVSVAGIVSLFFAASILSIVEIFYLLFRSQ